MTDLFLSEGDAMLLLDTPAEKKKPKRKKGLSPNTLTVRRLQAEGWLVDTVEKRLPGCFITKDLFGFIDILAIRDGVTLAVQATTSPHVAARVTKIAESPNIIAVRKAGWTLQVWGWRDQDEYRVVDVS